MSAYGYSLYANVVKTSYRMVLRNDLGFPAEANPAEWTLIGTRSEAQLSDDTRRLIREQGYNLYKVDVTFAELSQRP